MKCDGRNSGRRRKHYADMHFTEGSDVHCVLHGLKSLLRRANLQLFTTLSVREVELSIRVGKGSSDGVMILCIPQLNRGIFHGKALRIDNGSGKMVNLDRFLVNDLRIALRPNLDESQ